MIRNYILIIAVCCLNIFITFSQSDNSSQIDPNLFPFYHGVASGDPLPNAVILWTRYTNEIPDNTNVRIDWRVATDREMVNIVTSGFGHTDASTDWTFKVDATGLQPDTHYYYDFKAHGKYSLTGRTKTAPAVTADNDGVRFGVVSCSHWSYGYFSAYRHLSNRDDLDCILHLGDYIYELLLSPGSQYHVRSPDVNAGETITLEDYRAMHAIYKLDKDLRAAHQQHPFIVVWDDHESTENSYEDGAAGHNPATEGVWEDRKSYSRQAFHEWIPIRSQPNTQSIYRSFEYGNLVNLVMLDTRLEGRDETNNSENANDAGRTLLGTDQLNWFKNNLSTSSKRWNIIGQQVMMAPLRDNGGIVNYDQWDGYTSERSEIFNYINDNNINNFVVLTGDVHSSWVHNLPLAGATAGSVGVEFVVTSVTSSSFKTANPTSLELFFIKLLNPHLKYMELLKRGYGVLDITKLKTQFDYFYLDDVTDPLSNESFATAYFVNNNETTANQAASATSRTGSTPNQAPELPYPYELTEVQDGSWTYYYSKNNLSQPLFGIEKTPTGIGANTSSLNATVTISDHTEVMSEKSGDYGNFVLSKYWNIANNTNPNGWVNIRFFYELELHAELENEVSAFSNNNLQIISPTLYIQMDDLFNPIIQTNAYGFNKPIKKSGVSSVLGTYNGHNYLELNEVLLTQETGGGIMKNVTTENLFPEPGTIRYNNQLNKIQGWDGTQWVNFN